MSCGYDGFLLFIVIDAQWAIFDFIDEIDMTDVSIRPMGISGFMDGIYATDRMNASHASVLVLVFFICILGVYGFIMFEMFVYLVFFVYFVLYVCLVFFVFGIFFICILCMFSVFMFVYVCV